MHDLEGLAVAMTLASAKDRADAEHRFIEALTYSSCREIIDMLDTVLGRDFFALPVWARNLAYRIACLLAPADEELLRRAAADVRCFGPDWDREADELEQRAESARRSSRAKGQ